MDQLTLDTDAIGRCCVANAPRPASKLPIGFPYVCPQCGREWRVARHIAGDLGTRTMFATLDELGEEAS